MTSRREQILDTAEHVLENVGADSFGVGELARALGIKPPSLYKHFGNLQAIEHALISRGFRRLGAALDQAAAATVASPLEAFCRAYRAQALAAPQLYRLMTDRPLDRSLLDPGAEIAGMSALLAYYQETPADHPRSRGAWAWVHGLASLEIAQRFPPNTDLDSTWAYAAHTLTQITPK